MRAAVVTESAERIERVGEAFANAGAGDAVGVVWAVAIGAARTFEGVAAAAPGDEGEREKKLFHGQVLAPPSAATPPSPAGICAAATRSYVNGFVPGLTKIGCDPHSDFEPL